MRALRLLRESGLLGGEGSWPRPSVRAASAPASLCVPFRVGGSVPQVPLLPSARPWCPPPPLSTSLFLPSPSHAHFASSRPLLLPP